jgi:hypothetical protein
MSRRLADYGGTILFRIGREKQGPDKTVMFLADKATFQDRLTDAVIDYTAKHGAVKDGERLVLQVYSHADLWYNPQDTDDSIVYLHPGPDLMSPDRTRKLWHTSAALFKNIQALLADQARKNRGILPK